MPYQDRYQIEIMKHRTVVLHDNLTGEVVASWSGLTAYLDAQAEKNRRDRELTDEMLWEWISNES